MYQNISQEMAKYLEAEYIRLNNEGYGYHWETHGVSIWEGPDDFCIWFDGLEYIAVYREWAINIPVSDRCPAPTPW